MSKNYMEHVAQMLGVEMEERFKIKTFEQYKFYINENGLQCDNDDLSAKSILSDLITGKHKIRKIPKRKHTGLEEVQEGEWVYPLFDVVDRMKSAEERQLGTREFSDRKIRDNWKRYIDIKKRLARAASELNAEPIQWDNMEQEQAKWYIFYGKYTRDIEIGETNSLCCDNIYFTSKEAADKAIEIVGEDDLIWMLRDFQPFIGYSTEVTENE